MAEATPCCRLGSALLPPGQRGGDGAGRRGHRGSHAGAEHRQPGGEDPVGTGRPELGQDGQRRGDQIEPIATMTEDDIAAAIATAIQRYLDGNIGPATAQQQRRRTPSDDEQLRERLAGPAR
jgi:hypothetical protein